MRYRTARRLAAAAVVLAAAAASNAQCDPRWATAFAGSQPDPDHPGDVFANAVAAYDPDGPGPAAPVLIAGGGRSFGTGLYLGMWTGSGWQPLLYGPGLTIVNALEVFDDPADDVDGPVLFVGGAVATQLNGREVVGILTWDGSTWRETDGSPSWMTQTKAFSIFDADGPQPPALYAAGWDPYNLTTSYLARRDAEGWTYFTAADGPDGNVFASVVHDPDGPGEGSAPPALYIAGDFTHVAGVPAAGVARFDGTSWSAVGGGFNGRVSALASFDPDGDGPAAPLLIAGGSFTSAGGSPASRIAAWDGASWSAMGSGADRRVFSLTVHDADGAGPMPAVLIAAGEFFSIDGLSVQRIASWDGSQWSPLRSGLNAEVYAVRSIAEDPLGPGEPALYAAGNFGGSGSLLSPRIARWGCPLPGSCPGDWNADGGANSQDVSAYLTGWLADLNGGTTEADINGDGVTNSSDISAFLGLWLDAVRGGCAA